MLIPDYNFSNICGIDCGDNVNVWTRYGCTFSFYVDILENELRVEIDTFTRQDGKRNHCFDFHIMYNLKTRLARCTYTDFIVCEVHGNLSEVFSSLTRRILSSNDDYLNLSSSYRKRCK